MGRWDLILGGEFTKIETHKKIEYVLEDNRKVSTTFTEFDSATIVEQIFDAEDENAAELQKQGWQSILFNFKKHVESKNLAVR